MKFLFIDDNGDFLAALQGAFRKNQNVAFAECHSVDEALRAIADNKPDVIFLDHHLTDRGNEGLEIADRVSGVKIYSTTTRTDLVPEYQQRGIEMVNKTDLKNYRSIINQSSAA